MHWKRVRRTLVPILRNSTFISCLVENNRDKVVQIKEVTLHV